MSSNDKAGAIALVLVQKTLLKDAGLTEEDIDSRIAKWSTTQGFTPSWRDMPEDAIAALGLAMKKVWEDITLGEW